MWIRNDMIEAVDRVAVVHYVTWDECVEYNAKKDPDAPRLMGGWAWSAKRGGQFEQCLRSKTAAYIKCWCTMVGKQEAPHLSVRRPLRLVGDQRRAA